MKFKKYLKKIPNRIWRWSTATKLRKILSSILIILILLNSIRFVLFRPKVARAADIYLGLDEGYGTSSAVNDSNGTVSAGSITNATWQQEAFCKVGKCLFFDGSGDNVSFSDDANFDMGTTDTVTIEGWFRTSDITSGSRTLITKTAPASGGYKIYMNSSGQIIFGIDNDSISFPADSVTSPSSYDDNNWHHFAAVKNGANSITLYIDALLVGTDTSLAGSNAANSASFLIGDDGDGVLGDWLGFVDEIKVLRSARTATEVKSDFTGGTLSRGSSASFGPDQSYLSDGLVGYWKLNETSGNATDSSGNGNSLTNNGTTGFAAGKFDYAAGTFDGSTKYFSSSASLSVQTISFWAYPASTSDNFFNLASGVYLTSSSGTLSATGFTDPKIYVNGVQGTTISANMWQLITVTDTTSITADTIRFGQANGSYYTSGGYLDDIRLYNRTFTPSEVSNLYFWAPGPAGYWKLNENVTGDSLTMYDSSGNGNNATAYDGTDNSGINCAHSGKYGSSCEFDGNDDYLEVTNSSDFKVDDTDNFSVTFWTYLDSLTGTAFLNKRTSYATMDWDIGIQASPWFDVRMAIGESNAVTLFDNHAVGEGAVVTAGKWYHVAVVKDGTDYSAYLDGAFKISETSSQTWTDSDNFTFGKSQPSTSDAFYGLMDEIKIYNYALSPGQIIQDMNAGHPAPGSPVGSAFGHWKFETGYGDTAYDSGTGGNNGDLGDSATTCPGSAIECPEWSPDGKISKALYFMNGNNHVLYSDIDELDGISQLTVSMWFNADTLSTARGLIGKWYDWSLADNEYSWRIGSAATNDEFQMNVSTDKDTDNGTRYTTTNFDLVAGTWTLITVVYDGTLAANDRVKFYKNGQLVNGFVESGVIPTSLTSGTGDLSFGDYPNTGIGYNGYYDDIRIYTSALSPEQIKVIYNLGSVATMGATSTDSSNNSTWSALNAYCPPGQGSTCTAPIADWHFDENDNTSATTNDVSGNEKALTLTNSPTFTTGKYGSAINFNGNNQHLIRADDIDFDYNAGVSVSWEAWIRHNTASAQEIILSKFNERGYKILMEADGDITCGLDYDSTWSPTDSATSTAATYDDNTWHHIACVKSGSNTLTLYIDGMPVAYDTSLTNGPISSSDPLYIGIDADATSNDWIGDIDGVRVYNYARSLAQVMWDYNRGGPIGWWKFDENTGSAPSTLYDSSGKGNNGSAGGSMTAADWVAGKLNTGLDFDGTDDVVTVSNASEIDFDEGLQDGMSFTAWVYVNSDGEANLGEIFDKGANTYCRTDSESGNNVDLECQINLTGIDANMNIPAGLSLNTWHHIAVGFTDDLDDEITMYIDGVNKGTSTGASGSPQPSDTNDLLIGGDSTHNFDGVIDDFRVYNFELTTQQVRAIMSEGAVRFGPNTGTP